MREWTFRGENTLCGDDKWDKLLLLNQTWIINVIILYWYVVESICGGNVLPIVLM